MCEQCMPSQMSLFKDMTAKEFVALTKEQIVNLVGKISDLQTVPQQWRERGAYYGYPSCCVNSFVRRPFYKNYSEDEIKYSAAGFIPCKKHLKMIKQGKIQIKDLIKDRKCKTAFPIDDLDLKE